jgi:hypothetical protein
MNDNDAAIEKLRALAVRFCAVQVTFSDCGCVTVEYFNGEKVVEEDKDLLTAVINAEAHGRLD